MPVILRTGIRAPEQSTPATPASGSRVLYPKSTGWYDLDSAGVERRITQSAVLWTPQGTPTTADEFNDASLDAAWTQVTAGGSVTWTEAADVMSVSYNANGANK